VRIARPHISGREQPQDFRGGRGIAERPRLLDPGGDLVRVDRQPRARATLHLGGPHLDGVDAGRVVRIGRTRIEPAQLRFVAGMRRGEHGGQLSNLGRLPQRGERAAHPIEAQAREIGVDALPCARIAVLLDPGVHVLVERSEHPAHRIGLQPRREGRLVPRTLARPLATTLVRRSITRHRRIAVPQVDEPQHGRRPQHPRGSGRARLRLL